MNTIKIPDGSPTLAIEIADIDWTFPAQTRAAEDSERIEDYTKAMRAGARFPMPLAVLGANGWVIIDGHHRIKAAKAAELTTIEISAVTKPVGVDATDYAKLLTISCNNRHGVAKTRADKHREIEVTIPLLLRCGMSNRQMADTLTCDEKTIRNIRAALPSVVTVLDQALRAATGADDFIVQTEEEAVVITEQVAMYDVGTEDISANVSGHRPSTIQEIKRRVKKNAGKLGISETDANRVLLAAASILAQMNQADAAQVVSALYTLHTQQAAA